MNVVIQNLDTEIYLLIKPDSQSSIINIAVLHDDVVLRPVAIDTENAVQGGKFVKNVIAHTRSRILIVKLHL